jgi:integrase
MAKKTFITKARLVKGKRWYIDFTKVNPATGEESRHRQDFDLNDIENLETREMVGKIIANNIKQFGQSHVQETVPTKKGETVKTAIEYARAEKMSGPRKNTHKGYKSICKSFLEWAEKRGYADIQIKDFGITHAKSFWQFVKTAKQYKGVTLNNKLIHIRSIWNFLIDQEKADKNPFNKIKLAPVEEKTRRAFTEDEKYIVSDYIKQHDYWLFRALLLQYYCYIRPIEISRLKFRAFNFTDGSIKIEGFEAKKWKQRVATIPKSIMHYFTDNVFNKQPTNYFIIGNIDNKRIGPSPKPAAENRQYTRHKKYLIKLKESGELKSIEGLTWYSWKDTGISNHVKNTTPLSTRDQAGHTDFQMTLTYYHADTVNEEYRKLPDDLIK